MKKLEAIIKPFRLDQVREALADVGIEGMTISEVKDFARQGGWQNGGWEAGMPGEGPGPAAGYATDFLPKLKVEVVMMDDLLDAALAAVSQAACRNRTGEEKVFVTSIEQVVRIRTEQTGREAI